MDTGSGRGDTDAWQVREDRRELERTARDKIGKLRERRARYSLAAGMFDGCLVVSAVAAVWQWAVLFANAENDPDQPLTRGPATEIGLAVAVSVLAVGLGAARIVAHIADRHHRLSDDINAKHDELCIHLAAGLKDDVRNIVARSAMPPPGSSEDREAQDVLWRTTHSLANGPHAAGTVYPFPRDRGRG